MSGAEKVISILGLVASAAIAAAIAVGAFQSALTLGIAAAAIAAGIAAIMLSINSATKRANQASQDLQKVAASGGRSSAYGDIPGLASGGVVPPTIRSWRCWATTNARPRLWHPILLSSRRPETPFDERGGASRAGGTAIAYLYLDGVKVGRAVYPYIQGETTRLGTKLVGGRR